MGWRKSLILSCDSPFCGEYVESFDAQATRQKVKARAIRGGWTFHKNGRATCEVCGRHKVANERQGAGL